MKKVSEWLKKYMVFLWGIASILFAFIIHCLFSETAPNEWIAAKWGAGDILTYASTVALGLLAVWQNQKFKEENDASQTRMENLTNKANEFSVVSKIIEHENERITVLKNKAQHFIDVCNTEGILEDLSDVATQPSDFMKTYVKIKMDSRGKQIRLCAVELLSELQLYPDDSKTVELIKCISKYSESSIALVSDMRVNSLVEETYTKKKSIEKEFITGIYDFISAREELLNRVIYENLSLEQIKALYHKEEQTNGKNENGVA